MSLQNAQIEMQPGMESVELSEPVETKQPGVHQPMDPMRAPPQTAQAEPELKLRGGEACPGRFCFIIPCPIPCNFCVFPCPC